MSESGTRVALVGEELDLAAAVRNGGGTVGGPETADVVIAIGESALIETARAQLSVPILPVAIDGGRYAVAKPDAADAVARVARGEGRAINHPILKVTVDGDPAGRTVLDVSLFTNEPARISEFAIHEGNETIDSVRADGVVVATPLGSHGYARAAGAPTLTVDAGLAVAPVAPFATQSSDWVLGGDVRLTVEREEEPVSLYLDGTRHGTVSASDPVVVRAVDSVPLLRLPETGDAR